MKKILIIGPLAMHTMQDKFLFMQKEAKLLRAGYYAENIFLDIHYARSYEERMKKYTESIPICDGVVFMNAFSEMDNDEIFLFSLSQVLKKAVISNVQLEDSREVSYIRKKLEKLYTL